MAIPAALIPLLFQAGLGGAQAIGGAIKRGNNKRPDYKIPASAKRALALAKMRAGDPNMPGYDLEAANIALTQSNALSASRESGNVAESVSSISAATDTANRRLGSANSQSQQRDLETLESAENSMAKYEDQEFQMNEFAPFSDARTESTQMIGAGAQNIFQALDGYGAYSQYSDLTGKKKAKSFGNPPGSTEISSLLMKLLPQLLKL